MAVLIHSSSAVNCLTSDGRGSALAGKVTVGLVSQLHMHLRTQWLKKKMIRLPTPLYGLWHCLPLPLSSTCTEVKLAEYVS